MAVLYLKYVEMWIPFPIHGILCLLAYVFWSAAALVLAPVVFIFRLYKLIETSLIKYQKLGTVFCTLDVPFLHETENNRNFIIGMVKIRGNKSVEEIRKSILSRLFDKRLDETYRRLSQRITQYYWSYVWEEEQKFDINQHVPLHKGRIPKTQRQIENMFEKFAREDFPEDISPWMIRIIPSQKNDEFFMFFKFHHTIGDGFAMVGLLSQLADKKPELIQKSSSTRKINFMSNPVKRLIFGVLTGPLALLILVFSINRKNPFRPKVTPVKKNISWTSPISLELVKKLKNKTDSTVNDVMMSCLAGAIHRYLSEVKQKQPTDFPVAMTYNSRSTSEKIADIIPLGNHSGGLFLSLPVSVADPIKRLEKTRLRINKLKASPHPHLFSFIYFKIVGGLPNIIGRFSTFSVNRHISLIVSNVPGPTEPIHYLGCPVESIVFSPPLHGDVGLVASIFSYNKSLRLTVMSDKTVIKDLFRLTEYFEKEVHSLVERVLIED